MARRLDNQGMIVAAVEVFEPEPESVREVRRFLVDFVPSTERLHDIVLVASELATNVVRHARTPFEVAVDLRDGHLRVEVANGSAMIPTIEDLTDGHWGLRIVDRLTERWGIESTDDGKVTWAEFDLRPVQRPM